MQRGAKIALGVLVAGAAVVALVASESDAKAAALPPVNPPLPPPQPGSVPLPPSGGIIMVPPVPEAGDDDSGPGPGSPAPVVTPPASGPIPLPGGGSFNPGTGVGPGSVPLPGVGPETGGDPMSLPPLNNGVTLTLPGIGTFNPNTGNVFSNPGGLLIGTFDPRTLIFTPTNGQPIQLPSIPGLPSLPGAPVSLPPVVSPGGVPTAPLPGNSGGNTGIVPPTQVLPPMIIEAGNPSQPTTASIDTMTTVAAMLAQEQAPRWRKMPEPTLVTWQKNRGLTADGKFGTGTALKLAEEIGTVPIIRAWPQGSYPEGKWLNDYRAKLRTLAASAPEPRRSQLLAAIEREQGQGWGTPEKPITSLIHLAEA